MAKVKVNDIELYYETHGDGYPLVMIMGLSGNSDWWDKSFVSEISKRFKIILFDNRGAGRSDKPDIEYSIKMLADDAVGLMKALNIEKAYVLGFSMGGMIAQELVLNYPDYVDKLILCSSNCGGRRAVPPPPEVLQLLYMNTKGMSREEIIDKTLIPLLFSEDFKKNQPSTVEAMRRVILTNPIPKHSYLRQIKAVNLHNAGKRLEAVKCPTLVMQGTKDILAVPKNAEVFAKLIPHAKVEYIDNGAHLFFSEFPESAAKVVLEFL